MMYRQVTNLLVHCQDVFLSVRFRRRTSNTTGGSPLTDMGQAGYGDGVAAATSYGEGAEGPAGLLSRGDWDLGEGDVL